MIRVFVALLVVASASAAPIPKGALPILGKINANTLILAHRANLKLEASSDWQNWPAAHAFDQNEATSWFSNSGDTPTQGRTPWVQVTFPERVVVRRVTIRGNRDPQYPTGYFALEGKIELFDRAGKLVAARDVKSAGEKHDFEFVPKGTASGVWAVRFTCTKDEGPNGCVAVGEFQVE